MTLKTFRVYEIEHDGDLHNAIAAVRLTGAREVAVITADFDGEESAVLRGNWPDGTDFQQVMLKLEQEGVCL